MPSAVKGQPESQHWESVSHNTDVRRVTLRITSGLDVTLEEQFEYSVLVRSSRPSSTSMWPKQQPWPTIVVGWSREAQRAHAVRVLDTHCSDSGD